LDFGNAYERDYVAKIAPSPPERLRWAQVRLRIPGKTAAAIEKLGRELKAMRLTLSYHNHDIEMRNAAREFHQMMAGRDQACIHRVCLRSGFIRP